MENNNIEELNQNIKEVTEVTEETIEESTNEVNETAEQVEETVNEVEESTKETEETTEEVTEEVTDQEVIVPSIDNNVKNNEVIGKISGFEKLYVRKEASKDSEPAGIITSETILTIDEENSTEDFYKVTTNEGLEGYCVKKFVKIN